MINLNAKDYKKLPEKEKKKLQERFHENDLTYFSSMAFESGILNQEDINELNSTIDKRLSGNFFGFNFNFFITLAIGVFIGSSLFFLASRTEKVQKTQHGNLIPENGLKVSETICKITKEPTEFLNKQENEAQIEHFHTSQPKAQPTISNPMEDMSIKEITSIEMKESVSEQEELISYIPNSSVTFIYNLKVANYKNYYFKNNRNIDVRNNGLSPQFSNKEEEMVEGLNKRLQDRDYYAHEIIKDAMQAFDKKQFGVSIDLLELLHGYNKDDVNTQFYIGMSYYYLGNYGKSLTLFNSTMDNEVNIFLQEAEFYSALCLKKTGKTNEANELFRKIAGKKLFYAQRATEELN